MATSKTTPQFPLLYSRALTLLGGPFPKRMTLIAEKLSRIFAKANTMDPEGGGRGVSVRKYGWIEDGLDTRAWIGEPDWGDLFLGT